MPETVSNIYQFQNNFFIEQPNSCRAHPPFASQLCFSSARGWWGPLFQLTLFYGCFYAPPRSIFDLDEWQPRLQLCVRTSVLVLTRTLLHGAETSTLTHWWRTLKLHIMAGNKSDLNFFIWSATELDRFCGVNGSALGYEKKSYNFWW